MTDSSPWKDPPFTISKNGKPSISMGHLYHGCVSHNQRVMVFNGIEGWKCRTSLNLPLASGYAAYDFWLGDTPGGSVGGGVCRKWVRKPPRSPCSIAGSEDNH